MNLNTFISPSKSLRITFHVIFWICAYMFFSFFYGRISGNPQASFILMLYSFPVYISATYLAMYYIIPRYLLQKRYKSFLVSSFYLIMGAAFLELALIIYFIVVTDPILIGGEQPMNEVSTNSLDIYLRLLGLMGIIFFASSVKLLKHWYNIQRVNQMLAKEKLEAELNFLKSQVHPHFLFNTLNNLYALTLKKSEKSPDVVLKLSEMLDYMLYQCNEEKISLEKEIKLIENYISLEQLRFSDKVDIAVDINGRTINKLIAPMILFPLIENCFKHGISNDTKNGWIIIKLSVDRNELLFKVSNSKPQNSAVKQKEISKGIGLTNVKKRLQLIYPNKHKLDIIEKDNSFSCTLILDLID
jgi:two-component system LytT family sensor kinase